MSDLDDPSENLLDLPWYLTKRLGPDEAARIEADLARDPELARALEIAREELAETVGSNEDLGAPSLAAREALFARIDAEAARKRSTRGVLDGLLRRLSGLSPPILATAAAAAFAVIVVQGALLSGMFRGGIDDPRYVTASAPSAPVAAGEIVLVGFAPTASVAAIVDLLHEAHGTIVSGPRPGNLFEVRLADHRLAAPDLQNAIAHLRDQTGVVQFVASESGAP